ncbi:MAG: DUF5060 domain-containing protein [Planctomycetota bacterium]|jgi:hypothetical protein
MMNRVNLSSLLCLAFFATPFVKHCRAAGDASVGQWDRFEASVKNAKDYRDPYADVTLDVTYEDPRDRTTKFWGFYDGAGTWKIRFMPDRIGTWKYRAVFSDGSSGISGTFECIQSDIPGMISADRANPAWFGYKSGEHVLIRSFHVGDRFFAENWPAAKRKAFLDWAQTQGYNMLSVASHYLNRDAEGRGRGWRTYLTTCRRAGLWYIPSRVSSGKVRTFQQSALSRYGTSNISLPDSGPTGTCCLTWQVPSRRLRQRNSRTP